MFRVFACACAQRERPLREERRKCDFDRFTFWCSSTISDNLSVSPSGYRLSPVAWNEYACRIRSRTVCALRVCVRVPCAQFVARPASIRKWRQENRYDVLSLVIVWIRVIPCTRRMERNLTNRIVVWTNDKERNVTLILFNKEKSQSFIYLRPCRAWLSLALRSIGQSYTWWHMHFQKKIGHCFAHL